MKILGRGKTKRGIPVVRTPQFPGLAGKDLSIEQVRAIIRRQKRCRGFRFGLVAGINADLNIQISGDARTFLGFSVLLDNQTAGADPTEMTLTINNEIVISQVDPQFFSPDFMDDEYYFFPRPLSGQDDIELSVTNDVGTVDFLLAVYYI